MIPPRTCIFISNYIHSLVSATSLNNMGAGGTIIRLHSWGQYSKTYILHTGYSLEVLLCPQVGATFLKFEPNQLEAGRLSTMQALMLNYKCSFLGLMINLAEHLSCMRQGVVFLAILSALLLLELCIFISMIDPVEHQRCMRQQVACPLHAQCLQSHSQTPSCLGLGGWGQGTVT